MQYFGACLEEERKKSIDLVFEFCETTLKAECEDTLEPRAIIQWTRQLLEVSQEFRQISLKNDWNLSKSDLVNQTVC